MKKSKTKFRIGFLLLSIVVVACISTKQFTPPNSDLQDVPHLLLDQSLDNLDELFDGEKILNLDERKTTLQFNSFKNDDLLSTTVKTKKINREFQKAMLTYEEIDYNGVKFYQDNSDQLYSKEGLYKKIANTHYFSGIFKLTPPHEPVMVVGTDDQGYVTIVRNGLPTLEDYLLATNQPECSHSLGVNSSAQNTAQKVLEYTIHNDPYRIGGGNEDYNLLVELFHEGFEMWSSVMQNRIVFKYRCDFDTEFEDPNDQLCVIHPNSSSSSVKKFAQVVGRTDVNIYSTFFTHRCNNKLITRGQQKIIVLHEIGHILGFWHETYNEGAPPKCSWDSHSGGVTGLTLYDPLSIMFYLCTETICSIDSNRVNNPFSELDIIAIQEVFVNNSI